ncbi:hypothetical protein SBDP1_130060 [Syntrophobacter sp. SbD1]|nr:hypothetical protein SBDP1_130060 [Syntrophobacter sp. SbD1]
MPGIGQIFQSGLWAYEHNNPHADVHPPPGLDFIGNFANCFLDGMNAATGRKVDQNWWVHALEAVGTDPFLLGATPLGGFPPRQVITLVKGYLDLKSGKSATGWSLIDRGARFEHRDEERAKPWPKAGVGSNKGKGIWKKW